MRLLWICKVLKKEKNRNIERKNGNKKNLEKIKNIFKLSKFILYIYSNLFYLFIYYIRLRNLKNIFQNEIRQKQNHFP